MTWWYALLLIVIVTLATGGYIVFVIVSAYFEVKSAPREPMFLCSKHGPIKKEHLLVFKNYEGIYRDRLTGKIETRRGDQEYCILCFDERLKAADKIP